MLEFKLGCYSTGMKGCPVSRWYRAECPERKGKDALLWEDCSWGKAPNRRKVSLWHWICVRLEDPLGVYKIFLFNRVPSLCQILRDSEKFGTGFKDSYVPKRRWNRKA